MKPFSDKVKAGANNSRQHITITNEKMRTLVEDSLQRIGAERDSEIHFK